MPDYIVTGKKGSGKSLGAVMVMCMDYISQGRRVVTNLDIFPENFQNTKLDQNDFNVIRIPDYPSAADFEMVGKGNPDPTDEDRNGMMLLDEGAVWLNSRNWQDKRRAAVLDWIIHARKLGWNCYLLAQTHGMLDKQIVDAMGEHIVYCGRWDRKGLPVVGRMLRTAGIRSGGAPKSHSAHVCYGTKESSPTVDIWRYNAKIYGPLYDTTQRFKEPDQFAAPYSLLTPWHINGRYQLSAVSADSVFSQAKKIIYVPLLISYLIGYRWPSLRPYFWLPQWRRVE